MLPSFFRAIGTDRYLTEQELVDAVGHHPELSHAWGVYTGAFDGFCETTLDPLFHRLSHPARSLGSLALDADEPVLVVGTGPSAARALPAVARVRDRLRLFTSPRGAEMLAHHGLIPDLVLVEHRTALDAHHSVRHLRDSPHADLRIVPLVAADWRTPAALLAGVTPARLFIPDPLPTWGAWPATAVAMAAAAGAARIALLGIDLGTAEQPDPEFVPLLRLLELQSRLVSSITMDCGEGGASKEGWPRRSIESLAGRRALGPLEIVRAVGPSVEQRHADALDALDRLSAVVQRTRRILTLATAARAGTPDVVGLREAAADMLSWHEDRAIRIDIQEALGVSFLPRLWRLGIDVSLDARLWRPLMLAAHELVGQANRLVAVAHRSAA